MADFVPDDMPVDTPNFSAFFADEDVRRHALRIIQSMKSLKNCEEDLGPEEYMEWRDTIMAMVEVFSDIYDTHGLPEMEMLACQDENNNNINNNNNGAGPLNQAFIAPNNGAMAQLMANLGYAPPEPAPVNVPNSGELLHLTAGATNALTEENIKEGNVLVNFDNEYGEDRYHLKTSFNKWKTLPSGQKENPYTRAAIENAKTYRATFAPPPLEGGVRQKRKTRRTKRRRHPRALSRKRRHRAAY